MEDPMFDPKLKEALGRVQKPGRYTGGEPGSIYKEKDKEICEANNRSRDCSVNVEPDKYVYMSAQGRSFWSVGSGCWCSYSL